MVDGKKAIDFGAKTRMLFFIFLSRGRGYPIAQSHIAGLQTTAQSAGQEECNFICPWLGGNKHSQ
jgi:hypothetical protein